jgi:hypothetical protein
MPLPLKNLTTLQKDLTKIIKNTPFYFNPAHPVTLSGIILLKKV